MTRASYVVTGGSQGVGRAIAERLAADGHVVVVDVTESSGWDHPSAEFVTGDARTADVVQQAAARAEAVAPLIGWVNNAVHLPRRNADLSMRPPRPRSTADAPRKARTRKRPSRFGIAAYAGLMAIQRMDNVGIVVDDLEAATAFFVELGLELEGEAPVEGPWVDRIVGLDGVRADIAMMRTPDGHSRLELTKFHTPAAISAAPDAPANALGIRRMMFAVDDIDDVVARLRTHGAELVGEVVQYEDSYRLCYLRGPEGIIVALAEQLG